MASPIEEAPAPTESELRRAIASAYGVELAGARLIRQGGAINRVFRVTTGDADLVLRVHRPETTADRLTAVHRIQDQLRASGLPIPGLYRTHTGHSWLQVDGHLVEVLRYVPHGHEVATWADAATALATLGALHRWLRTIEAPQLPPPVHPCYMTPPTGLALLALTAEAMPALRGDPAFPRAVAIQRATRTLLHRLVPVWRRYERGLPHMLVHGDFVGNNVLIRGRAVVAILDFDRLAVRPRVYDVAYTLMYVLSRLVRTGQRTPGADHGLTTDDVRRLGQLLARYARSAEWELAPAELLALPHEMARAPLYPVVAAGLTVTVAIAETVEFGVHLPLGQWLVEQAAQVSTSLEEAIAHHAR